jgi:hypothetical protein
MEGRNVRPGTRSERSQGFTTTKSQTRQKKIQKKEINQSTNQPINQSTNPHEKKTKGYNSYNCHQPKIKEFPYNYLYMYIYIYIYVSREREIHDYFICRQ